MFNDLSLGPAEYPQLSTNKLWAFYLLRHIKLRSLRRKILNIFNYYRSVEKKLTVDAYGFTFPIKTSPNADPFQLNIDEDEEESEVSTKNINIY